MAEMGWGNSGYFPEGNNFDIPCTDGTIYVDGMNKTDRRPEMRKNYVESLSKALTVSGATAGTTYDRALIPIYQDPVIADQTRRLTPLVELLPRATNFGRVAVFNKLTARGIVGWLPEDATLAERDDTYPAPANVAMAYGYTIGRVAGPFQAASRQFLSQNYTDAINLEVRNKTISFRYMEEDTYVNGTTAARGGTSAFSGTTGAYAARYGAADTTSANANEPLGILAQLSVAAYKTAQAGVVTIAAIRNTIRYARTANDDASLGQGDPNLIVTDFGTLDNVKGLLQDYQRYVNTNFEIAWGLKTVEFEGLPIVPSKFMPPTTAYRSLAVLSTDAWQVRVLQDVTYEELAKTNDSYKFMIKAYEALIAPGLPFNWMLNTIT